MTNSKTVKRGKQQAIKTEAEVYVLWSGIGAPSGQQVYPLTQVSKMWIPFDGNKEAAMVSAADGGYPLGPRPDAVALYSGCTPGKRRAWFLLDDRHTASLVGLRGGWRHTKIKFCFAHMDPSQLCPGKGFVLANLTFDEISPKLPTNIKADYLNCKIRPYVPNPLRCFKCQRFGHSQTACRGNLTDSRFSSVGHSSTDCSVKPKCINFSQCHPSDSKLCSNWKTEKRT
ncbi:uncharacterized protein TNCV_3239371 [Trichonephila clavipes]|nr:uncharacterized protein TNCV_3239371 [Trichonephila clavipes]